MSQCMNTCCAINEVLLRLMCERIKVECINTSNSGATVEEINTVLVEHIIPYYEQWRREMLRKGRDDDL